MKQGNAMIVRMHGVEAVVHSSIKDQPRGDHWPRGMIWTSARRPTKKEVAMFDPILDRVEAEVTVQLSSEAWAAVGGGDEPDAKG